MTTLQVPGTVLEVAPGSGDVADVQSFAPTVEPDADIASSPPDIRAPRARGLMAVPWPGRLLPAAILLAALPGVLLWSQRGVRVLAARRRERREPAAPVRDPAARLRNLPPEREARLRELDAALREWLSLRTDQDLESLDRRVALEALPDALRERVTEVAAALDRARFAGASSEGLEQVLSALIDARGETP